MLQSNLIFVRHRELIIDSSRGNDCLATLLCKNRKAGKQQTQPEAKSQAQCLSTFAFALFADRPCKIDLLSIDAGCGQVTQYDDAWFAYTLGLLTICIHVHARTFFN